MALIKDSYDLVGGATRSSVISSASYIELQTLLGTVGGYVKYTVQRKQSTGDWIDLKDDRGEKIIFTTKDESEDGVIINGLNGASDISVYIEPSGNTTGTISLDAETDGTIV